MSITQKIEKHDAVVAARSVVGAEVPRCENVGMGRKAYAEPQLSVFRFSNGGIIATSSLLDGGAGPGATLPSMTVEEGAW